MSTKKNSHTDDEISNKLVLIFFATIIALGALMVVNRLMIYGSTFLTGLRTVQTLAVISGVALAVSAVCFFARAAHRKIWGSVFKFSAAVLAASGFILLTDFVFAIKALYVIISAVSALFFIYYIYPHEFFYHTVLCTVSGVALWVLSHFMGRDSVSGSAIFITSLALFFMFAALLILFLTMKNQGVLSVFSKKIKIFTRQTNYALLFITFAVIIASLAAAFIVYSASFAYYLIFALLGYLVVLAIYFTTRII